MSGNGKLRVVLVDDHHLVRAGIRAVLEGLGDIEIVGEAADAAAALALLRKQKPDLALLDIALKEGSGLKVAREIRAEQPELKIVMLSMHSTEEYVMEALHCGATGYILKDAAVDELKLALEALRSGETYLSPAVSRKVIDSYLGKVKAPTGEGQALTPRQREILKLIAEGKATKQIAFLLNLSVKTVETHRAQIMERLGIRDVAGLVKYALRIGLVDQA
jgi:DNA-binding NarL/FixJ family response regulator